MQAWAAISMFQRTRWLICVTRNQVTGVLALTKPFSKHTDTVPPFQELGANSVTIGPLSFNEEIASQHHKEPKLYRD